MGMHHHRIYFLPPLCQRTLCPQYRREELEDSGASIPLPGPCALKSAPAVHLICIIKIKKKTKTLVELQGFEPWTPALQRQCSSQLSYSPFSSKQLAVGSWQIS